MLCLLLTSADAWSGPIVNPTRTAVHAIPRAPLVAVAADPFASPVFLSNAADSATSVSQNIDLVQVITVYVALMVVLNAWEYFVLPKLQDAGLMPHLREGQGSLSAVRKAKEGTCFKHCSAKPAQHRLDNKSIIAPFFLEKSIIAPLLYALYLMAGAQCAVAPFSHALQVP